MHMEFEYKNSKEQTIDALQNIENMVHDSVSQAIWEFNTTQLDSILNGLYTNKFLVGVKLEVAQDKAIPEFENQEIGLIEDTAGNMFFVDPTTDTETPRTDTFERLIPYVFDIYHTNILNNRELIGKMYLYSSNKVVFNQVKDSYILLIVNAMIKTIALWIVFLWAGYYYVSKPLKQLTEATKRLSEGDWDTDVQLSSRRHRKKTEINTLFDSFNDMTRQLHLTQDKLQGSRNELNKIFDTMPSALIYINQQGTIKGWNKHMLQETGIDSGRAIGQNIKDVYPAFAKYMYLVTDAIKGNREVQVKNAKIIASHKDDNRLFDIEVYPMPSDKIPEVVIRIDDITEEATHEADLIQVEKLASVGASIAGVAHEINNPLGSIMQGTQNVLRRLDPNLDGNKKVANELNIDLQQQHKYLEQREIVKFLNDIHEAGERASSIVKNMLKFTRRSTSEMTKTNLAHIINDSIQLASTDVSLQEKADFNQIEIIKNLDNDAEIECFPMEIQQVILNLLKNAAQALDHNKSKREIVINLLKQADNKIRLEIIDNGQGINAEILNKIFEPFFTTKAIGEGTGLGLSVCKNIIVQKHHGAMDVESTEGVGTKFIISLPIIQKL